MWFPAYSSTSKVKIPPLRPLRRCSSSPCFSAGGFHATAASDTGDLYFFALSASFFSGGFFSLILQIALHLPKRCFVSKVTVAVKVSLSPASLRSLGTRHEYPQVPPQPKGIVPSATFFPEESVMTTIGSSAA